VKKNTDADFKP